ncbi:MAG TPA: FHA domain-containing protein [Gemmataceae bacterium]|nr:FHA domain-containing protein [Gemmataceae bacterium]
MALLLRIYFNAVFGALGGLLGWLLFGVFGDKTSSSTSQQLLGGALIGGFIGYFVVGVEALRDRSLLRFCRQASYGVLLGGLGGVGGFWLGEQVNYYLVGGLLTWHQGGSSTLRTVGEIVSRGLGWMFLGVAVGVSEGAAARSLGKLSYGTIGGAIGGLLGGSLYGVVKSLERIGEGGNHILGGALGLVILGACIGALSAFVQGVLQPASLRVLRGWQEGREYALLKADNLVGRDEGADIPLFRDMRIEKKHVVIQREGPGYVLLNDHAPPDWTKVNDEPVAQYRKLRDGDRIQLGGVLLQFQMRAARSRDPKVAPATT